MEKLDDNEKDVIIRRLKVLSKSQTSFLKSFLHGKLAAGVSIVKKAVDLIEKDNRNQKNLKLDELKYALSSLKLEEIEVDVQSAQVMMNEELLLLRSSIERGLNGNVVMPPPPPTTSLAADTTKIKTLESENKELRALLAEAKKDLEANLKKSGKDAIKDITELAKKDQEIKNLKEEISNLMAAAASVGVQRSLEEEIRTVKVEVADLEKQLERTRKEAEDRLAARTAELGAETEKRVREMQTRLEGEKDEMMEAMAQEVEDIEKTKNAEKEILLKEKKMLQDNLTAALGAQKPMKQSLKQMSKYIAEYSKNMRGTLAATRKEVADMKGALKTQIDGRLIARLKQQDAEMKEIMERYKRELSERKKLHNIIQELKGNIRVYLRCRPPTSKEIEQFGNDAQCVAFPAPGEIRVYNEKNREKVWEFDEVFDTSSNQESVYKEVSALVTSVLDGFNVCIFAYGQTGSGKTYTMSGPTDDRGVNTRALNELFTKVSDRKSEYVDTISVSILEVYNEEIRDLLSDGPGDKLDVRQGDFGNYVPGLTCIAVRNLQNVIDLMALADKNRSSATTNMNEHSSRSHMMLQVIVQSENTTTGVNSRGKLNLVDLAGSERLNKSGAVGQALKEAQNINKSLSALGDVIAARASKQSHIPFRNSTLTYLLQDSLSQDSKTLMIVCISPVLYNSEETFCSLNFAARVRTVELGKASKTITNGSAPNSKAPTAGAASSKSGVRK